MVLTKMQELREQLDIANRALAEAEERRRKYEERKYDAQREAAAVGR
jgi:hypothetical protein